MTKKRRVMVLAGIAPLGFLLAGPLSLGHPVPNPWQPIIAKYREVTERIDARGNTTILKELRGDYYRASTGSVLTYWTDVTDLSPETVAEPSSGTFVDAETGYQYSLDYRAKRATRYKVSSWEALQVIRDQRPPQSSIVATAVVNGVDCVAQPFWSVGPNRTMQRIGLGWIAADHALFVKRETEQMEPSGSKVRIVKEKYDIRVGVEPPNGLIRIPEGFTTKVP